jgi:hypothetical protein
MVDCLIISYQRTRDLLGLIMTLHIDCASRYSVCPHGFNTCIDDMMFNAAWSALGLVLVVATGTWEGTTFLVNEEGQDIARLCTQPCAENAPHAI